MKVSDSVVELERQFTAMRERAERAEGVVRVYEARDNARSVAVSQQAKDQVFRIVTKDSEKDDHTIQFAPGLWLLMLAEDFIRNPRPFEVRVEALKPEEGQ